MVVTETLVRQRTEEPFPLHILRYVYLGSFPITLNSPVIYKLHNVSVVLKPFLFSVLFFLYIMYIYVIIEPDFLH